MELILNRTGSLRRLAQTLALGIALFALMFLGACAGDEPTEAPQPTATSTSAPATVVATPTDAPPPTEAAAPSGPQLQVVATSNIVADWAGVVGGDRAEVFSLHPSGGDPHNLVPGAGDVAKVADADVVLSIGLGLEAVWLEDLVHNASADPSRVVALGNGVDPLEFVETGGHGHDDHDDHMDEGGGELLGRLLIGDGELGNLSVIDLETGDVDQDHFDLGSRAGRIYATKSGRYAIAVSSDANTAHVFDGGIYMEPHGDHFDLVEGDVRKLPIDLSGDRPVHMYVGGEWAAVYYDGSGDFVLINEHELEEEGDSYVPVSMNAGAHHGAVVPLEGDLFAVTIQHPDFDQNPQDYRLPIGAEIWDLDGNVLHRAEGCPDLHGDAGNGHMAVFGCTGGVLMVEAHGGDYEHDFISAPAGSPEDFRLTSVWGYYGLDHFFALGSAVGLYVVEPEEGEMEMLIPATEALRPIQVHLGPGGETLLVVMSDGELRVYDAHDGELRASKRDFLTAPVETGFWARPHLATAPGAIFITDSVGGEVLQLDEHDLEVVRHWDVAGVPTKIAFVGIMGEAEGHEEHGHEEEGQDEHGHEGHDHGPLDPHFWFDPNRVKIAVYDIAARLSALDPEGASYYYRNAADYAVQLDELHTWIQEQVSVVAPERRLLVTSHDTFAYFADVYGFEVIGALIPSLAPDVEPSAEHLAEVVEVIREHNAPAVFSETTVSGRLPEAVARETGAEFAQLYADSLGERGSPAGTYLGMVRTNVEVMVGVLR
ncbi:MAG: metal ABC transporter substrate-binding protein [Chloroflexota bacterium]|nr:metal ABC transporter substrate-binding protein [Chloroflexota bacterium]MDE2942007.1 metal ABC transporter substrate-binding protein [Chloroflexota bacterium]MDE3267105.1 metal ABC transporter substrate-binding protein [Chloroflexota bacterium]